jgi:hypothetical protein
MAWDPQPGERVQFGAIQAFVVENLGYTIRIKSAGTPTFSMAVPTSALRPLGTQNGTAAQQPRALPPAIQPSEPDHGQGRAVLDALRFGLVPLAAAKGLTIGYDAFAAWAIKQLPDPSGVRLAAVSGPFGAGKSHAMALMRQMARERGALTAHVEIDGREVTLADPAAILRALWPTLDGPRIERAHSLLALHLGAKADRLRGAIAAGPVIDRVRDNHSLVRRLRDADALDHFADDLDAVMGSAHAPTASSVQQRIVKHFSQSHSIAKSDIVVRPMIGQKVEDRPTDFVAALVGYARLAEAAGWTGLLVTIDEFEIHGLSTPAAAQRAVKVLATLARLKTNQLGLLPAPLSVVFATIDDGGNEVASRLAKLIVGSGEEARWALPEIEADGRRELACRVSRLHAEVYGGSGVLDDATLRTAEAAVSGAGETIRPFLKRIVWDLDLRAFGSPP